MSAKDIRRVQMMGLVADGKRDLTRAAEVLGVSYRQAKRIYGGYREEGPAGVVHRNFGQRSHRSHSVELKAAVLEKYRGEYADFGPTLAAEKMGERDGLQIDHETLRRWLIGAGMWEVKRRRRKYRSRRERKHRFGELVQFDGSHHEWFEERGVKCCF
tara:strand:- start:538 stop:1011 length:474 start_codon:yes stop_codon:yes gene_type:complete